MSPFSRPLSPVETDKTAVFGVKQTPEQTPEQPLETKPAAKIENIADAFREISAKADRSFDFKRASIESFKDALDEKPFLELPPQAERERLDRKDLGDEPQAEADIPPNQQKGFNWRGAFTQSFMFLGVQHGYAVIFQKKTQRALKGEFFADWRDSVRNLKGWDDGNRFFTNYIAHPMQGALTGFIYVQNSPQARRQQFGASGDYWRSRLKAFLWSTAWSTQFELGPVSQASIGNIGLSGHQAWGDIVITPTVGTMVMITEEALDRYLIRSIERRTNNFYVKIFARMLFNPVRIFSNLLRLKEPWYRDPPLRQ